MFWSAKPTIIVKQIGEGKFTWFLYLSVNKKRPTCMSPTPYKDAFRARASAKKFASKFKGPMRLGDGKGEYEEVLYIDETKRYGEIDDENDATEEDCLT